MPVTATEKGLLDPVTAGRVQLRRWAPSTEAHHVIERFWTLHFDVGAPEVQPLLPDACANIAFGSADPGVHGPARYRDDHRIAGKGWVLGAKLRPGALVAMGLATGPELVDHCRPVAEVFGTPGHQVVEQITEDLDRRRGAGLIEDLVGRYLPIVDPAWDDLTEVIATMLANRSLIRVTDAARRPGFRPELSSVGSATTSVCPPAGCWPATACRTPPTCWPLAVPPTWLTLLTGWVTPIRPISPRHSLPRLACHRVRTPGGAEPGQRRRAPRRVDGGGNAFERCASQSRSRLQPNINTKIWKVTPTATIPAGG